MDATLEFKHAQANGAAVASYEIRYREGQSMTDDEFLQAIRAPLVAPGPPGSLATFTLSGLKPATQYVVGVRAADACGQTSPVVVLAFPTPVRKFKQVEGLLRRDRRLGVAAGGQRAGAPRPARPPAGGQRHRGGGHRPLLSVGARRGRRHPQGPHGAGPGPAAAGADRGAGAGHPRAIMRADVAVRVFAYRDVPWCVAGALEGRAFASRAVALNFTATERAQIAIWIEKRRRHVHGHRRADAGGERARHRQPSRRDADEQRLPLAVRTPRRRAADLGAPARGRARRAAVPARHLPEPAGGAMRRGRARTRRAITYFCLSFTPRARARTGSTPSAAPACSTATRAASARAPTEPAMINGEPTRRARWTRRRCIPPRRDFTACSTPRHDVNPLHARARDPARTTPTSATFADARARPSMPDIDAVTMATPPAGVRADGDVLDARRVAARATTSRGSRSTPRATTTRRSTPDTLPTPTTADDWDTWAVELRLSVPRPAVGRVQRAVHASADVRRRRRRRPRPGSDRSTGSTPTRACCTRWTARSPTIPRRARQRRRSAALIAPRGYRLQVEVRGQDFCMNHAAPEAPASMTAEPVADSKHSHQWGRLGFVVPPSELADRQIRGSLPAPARSSPAIPTSFIQGLPGEAASDEIGRADGPRRRARPARSVEVDFGGMTPSTHYWIAAARRRRLQPGRAARGRRAHHDQDQLHPAVGLLRRHGGLGIAAAAVGGGHAPGARPAAGRRPLFAVMSDLYQRSGPAAAALLGRSDAARVLARRLIGPLGMAAEAAQAQP